MKNISDSVLIVMICALVAVLITAGVTMVNMTRSFTLRTMTGPAQVYYLCARDNERDRLECARIVRDMNK